MARAEPLTLLDCDSSSQRYSNIVNRHCPRLSSTQITDCARAISCFISGSSTNSNVNVLWYTVPTLLCCVADTH